MLQPHMSQRLLKLFAVNERAGIESRRENPVPLAHGINLKHFIPIDRSKLPYRKNENLLNALFQMVINNNMLND